MIDDVMRSAFADELMKIATVNTIGSRVGHMLHAGWHGLDAKGAPVEGAGWMLGNKGWRSKVPLGGKSTTIATTALQLPMALGKEDPTGRGHSRLERITGLAGNTIGGLAATGALMGHKWFGRHAILSGILGGIGGGVLGERAATTPWALKRRMFRRYPQQVTPPQDEGWRNNAPGNLTTTPDAIIGQAENMR